MIPSYRWPPHVLTWVIVCSGVIGCSEPVGPTSGIIRFDNGTVVQSGSIELRRLTDQKRFSSRIADDGTFMPVGPSGKIGVPAGDYDVVVVQIVLTEDLAKEAHTHGTTVPRRYADYYTSGLKVKVDPGQLAPIEIRVESDQPHAKIKS